MVVGRAHPADGSRRELSSVILPEATATATATATDASSAKPTRKIDTSPTYGSPVAPPRRSGVGAERRRTVAQGVLTRAPASVAHRAAGMLT
jgi:hypothetical protein